MPFTKLGIGKTKMSYSTTPVCKVTLLILTDCQESRECQGLEETVVYWGRARTLWQNWISKVWRGRGMQSEEARNQIVWGLVTMARHFDVILSEIWNVGGLEHGRHSLILHLSLLWILSGELSVGRKEACPVNQLEDFYNNPGKNWLLLGRGGNSGCGDVLEFNTTVGLSWFNYGLYIWFERKKSMLILRFGAWVSGIGKTRVRIGLGCKVTNSFVLCMLSSSCQLVVWLEMLSW